MEETNVYRNLRFERRTRIPRRLIPIILAVILFTLLWNLIPQGSLYWLLMPLLAILTWIASYGWRQALTSLIGFLHRLEQF